MELLIEYLCCSLCWVEAGFFLVFLGWPVCSLWKSLGLELYVIKFELFSTVFSKALIFTIIIIIIIIIFGMNNF